MDVTADVLFLDSVGNKVHKIVVVCGLSLVDSLPLINEVIEAFEDELDLDYVSMEILH